MRESRENRVSNLIALSAVVERGENFLTHKTLMGNNTTPRKVVASCMKQSKRGQENTARFVRSL